MILRRILFAVFVTTLVASCTTNHVVTTVPTSNFKWTVKDPLLSRFVKICDSVELKAKGRFKKGTATVHGVKVDVDDTTDFTANFRIPIPADDQIELKNANGTLDLSRPIKVGGIPLPVNIALHPGTAVADIDITNGLSSFMLNAITTLPHAKGEGDTLGDLVSNLSVETLKLKLTPGKAMDFGSLHVVADKQSVVELNNLNVNDDLNFHGTCTLDLTFGKGCNYVGRKTEFAFNGGTANLLLTLDRQGPTYKFSLDKTQSTARLKDCRYRFGKIKQCTATSAIAALQINKFICEEHDDTNTYTLSTDSKMLLSDSDLEIVNARKTFTLDAAFSKPIPAFLSVNAETEKPIAVDWYTKQSNQADKLTVNIHPNSSSTLIEAGNTKVGPVTLSKEGDLSFEFDKGVSELRSLKWSSDKKEFKMVCSKGAQVSIPPGMSLNVLKDEKSTKTELPLNLGIGHAVVTSSRGNVELGEIQGRVKLVVDEVTSLTGDLRFALENSDLLGENKVDILASGLALTCVKGGAGQLGLDKCTLAVSHDALLKLLHDEVPDHEEFDVDKTLMDKQKWRYRNAKLKHITVSDLSVDKLESTGPNTEKFTVKGKVAVAGTIEKGGWLSPIKKDKSTWETKDWSATGDAEGDGTLTYQFVPATPLTNSKVQYSLDFDLKPTKNVDLDWSQVTDGLLSKAENSLITKFITSYDPKDFVKKAEVKIFKTTKTKFQNIAIKDVQTTPGPNNGLNVSFAAQIDM